jgi:hypothetical protein
MSTNGPNKNVTVKGVELHLDMISAGLPQVFPAGQIFQVGGKVMSFADLQKEVDSRRALFKSVRDLRNQLRAKTQEKRERRAELGAFIEDVKVAFTATLGRENPELTKLGFAVAKPRTPLTSEEKALRAAKSRETRAARHTLGSRQKESIKGEVDGVTLVPDGKDVKSIPNGPTPAAPKPAQPGATGKVA